MAVQVENGGSSRTDPSVSDDLVESLVFNRKTPVKSSPDGSMMLVTAVERSKADPVTYGCVIFEIRSAGGRVLWRENTGASAFHAWDMEWLGNGKLQLTSGDIGDYLWGRQPDGSWQKRKADPAAKPIKKTAPKSAPESGASRSRVE